MSSSNLPPSPLAARPSDPLPTKAHSAKGSKRAQKEAQPDHATEVASSGQLRRKEAVTKPRPLKRARKQKNKNVRSKLGKQKEKDVRPKFFCCANGGANRRRAPLADFLRVQRRQLQKFEVSFKNKRWGEIHNAHFDWYMFPIEDGSQEKWNVWPEDVEELRSNRQWRAGFLRAVELVAHAWGWSLQSEAAVPRHERSAGMKWTGWDVRLAKMIRSLWLFDELEAMRSLQSFARFVKPEGGFRYGSIDLDEILYMT